MTTYQNNILYGLICPNDLNKLFALTWAILQDDKAIAKGNKVFNAPGCIILGFSSLDLGLTLVPKLAPIFVITYIRPNIQQLLKITMNTKRISQKFQKRLFKALFLN